MNCPSESTGDNKVVAMAYTHGMDYHCSSSAPVEPPVSPKSPKSKSPLPEGATTHKKVSTAVHSNFEQKKNYTIPYYIKKLFKV